MRLISSTNREQKWEVEQNDVGTLVLLADEGDRLLTNADVGMLFVAQMNGKDRLEFAPIEEDDEADDIY